MTHPHYIDREAVALLPCPFCGSDLHIRRGVNPYGHCTTPECFANRAQIVPLDDPKQVAAWNCRPAPEAVAWREKVAMVIRERAQIGGTDWQRWSVSGDINAEEIADAILALIATHPVQGGEGQ